MTDDELRTALGSASTPTLQSLHCLLQVVTKNLDVSRLDAVCVHCDGSNFSCKLVSKLRTAPSGDRVHQR